MFVHAQHSRSGIRPSMRKIEAVILSAFVLALGPLCSLAYPLQTNAVDFFNPLDNGGSMLDDGNVPQLVPIYQTLTLRVPTAGSGGGEPLNVYTSHLSLTLYSAQHPS